jgi:hypothetical protein
MTNQINENLPEKTCSIERLVTIEADALDTKDERLGS